MSVRRSRARQTRSTSSACSAPTIGRARSNTNRDAQSADSRCYPTQKASAALSGTRDQIPSAQKIRAAGNKSSGSFLLVHAAASKPKPISRSPRHKAVKLHGLLGLALCLPAFLLRALGLFLSALLLGGLLCRLLLGGSSLLGH